MPWDPQTSKVMQRKIWVGIYFSQSLQRVLFNDDVTNPPCIVQTGLEEWLVQLELERKLIGAVQLEAGNKALIKRTRD